MVTIRLSESEARNLAMLLDSIANRVDENPVRKNDAKYFSSVIRHYVSRSS